MFKAIGKILKLGFLGLVILAGIIFFTDSQETNTETQTVTSSSNKIPENASTSESSLKCNSGYYKNSTKTSCLKVPQNATKSFVVEGVWYCNTGYTRSGVGCKKVASSNKESTKKVTTSESKPDKWWEKTNKYAICYGKVTAAHKANGLHTRDRDKSIEIKKQLCKIAATSTTGEGSFWLQ